MKDKAVWISKTPREIASEWHCGQASPFYAYSSTGHIDKYIQQEIKECWNLENTTYKYKLELANLWCTVSPNLTVDDMSADIYWHRTINIV